MIVWCEEKSSRPERKVVDQYNTDQMIQIRINESIRVITELKKTGRIKR